MITHLTTLDFDVAMTRKMNFSKDGFSRLPIISDWEGHISEMHLGQDIQE